EIEGRCVAEEPLRLVDAHAGPGAEEADQLRRQRMDGQLAVPGRRRAGTEPALDLLLPGLRQHGARHLAQPENLACTLDALADAALTLEDAVSLAHGARPLPLRQAPVGERLGLRHLHRPALA